MKFVNMPSVFLLEKNRRPAINTLSELIQWSNKDIVIDFSPLNEMTKGDLLVLSAQVEKSVHANKNRLYRKGALPKSKTLRALFSSTDKIHHVKKAIPLGELSDLDREKFIDTRFIDNIVKDLKKIGIKEYYFPFNTFLTELIGNAVEHGIENRNINWWLHQEYDQKTKVAKFTFVDMGLGIIDSHKKAGLPIKYYFQRKRHIVLDSLFGKLGSSTKKSNRGRGLPQLREMIEKRFVDNVLIITNTISLRYSDGDFMPSANPNFIGTYYSWTIDKNNLQEWKNTQLR